MEKSVYQGYKYAKSKYEEYGVDVDAALAILKTIPISMHCWQGDDNVGFDGGGALTGGIAVTGNYPGKACTPDQLRADIDKALSLIPGRKKVNLHASYAELNGKKVDRNEYTFDLYRNWIDWAKDRNLGLDFNPTYYSHRMLDGNYTLASAKPEVRKFWIEHGICCREIAQEIGKQTGKVCVNNFWMPDGNKDCTADTYAPRQRMMESLDEIFSKKMNPEYTVDTLESKLFGFGIESYTVANHEFSLGYAMSRGLAYCLDMGHFHPTEQISAKISSLMCFVDKLLIHVSRGIRWDSDHVVILDDELQNLMNEIVRGKFLDRVFIAQDYFDASINRVAAWVIAMRNTQKALLRALLEPSQAKQYEIKENYSARLSFLEEYKALPFGAIWDFYCEEQNVPTGRDWIKDMLDYDKITVTR